MKNLKYMSLMLALVSVMTMGLTACSDDDDNNTPAPVIQVEEANIEGDELCVEADIVAQGRTAAILINICDATGQTVKVAQPVTNSKYIGVLNIEGFHVHVDIDGKNVAVGDQLKLTVTDANGRSTTAQKAITEEEDEDEEHDHD
jgi:hypothetical protein